MTLVSQDPQVCLGWMVLPDKMGYRVFLGGKGNRVASRSKGTGGALVTLACPDFLEIEGLWALLDLAHKVHQARRVLKESLGARVPLEFQGPKGNLVKPSLKLALQVSLAPQAGMVKLGFQVIRVNQASLVCRGSQA